MHETELDTQPGHAPQTVTTPRHCRTVVVIAVAVSAIGAVVAAVDAHSTTDDDTIEIASGNTWS